MNQLEITRTIEIPMREYERKMVIKTADDGRFLGATVEELEYEKELSGDRFLRKPPPETREKEVAAELTVSRPQPDAPPQQIKTKGEEFANRELVAAGHGTLLVTRHNPYCFSYWDGRQWVQICYPKTAKC